MDRILLGERLIKEGFISQVQLETALKEQARTGGLLGEVLCSLGYASREDIKRVLVRDAGIEFISLKEVKIHEDILKLIPKDFALRHKVLPLTIKDNNTLQVVMSDPFDVKVIDELEALNGYFILAVTTTDEELNQALASYYDATAITLVHGPLNQQEIDDLVKKVAVSDNPIMIYGKSCACINLLALTIHCIYPGRGRPFVTLNCKGVTQTQLEEELFGYEKGFLQGILGNGRSHKGKLELARHGTLFLDEIGDIPLATQAKVLKILLTGEFERVGSTEVRRTTDVRIIATTSKDLDKAVEEGTFDKHLYLRLNVIPIVFIPPGERKADIPLWVGLFLENIRNKINRHDLRLSEDALQALMEYHWPGHLIEMESCLEKAAIEAKGELINRDCLPIQLEYQRKKEDTTDMQLPPK